MEREFGYEIWSALGILLLIISILGNLLTFIAVLTPKIRNKHEFDDSEWLSSTLFVLNLALADIIYCLFMFLNLTYGLLIYHEYTLGDVNDICRFFHFGLQDLGAIDGWSIALIAITQALPKIRYIIENSLNCKLGDFNF